MSSNIHCFITHHLPPGKTTIACEANFPMIRQGTKRTIGCYIDRIADIAVQGIVVWLCLRFEQTILFIYSIWPTVRPVPESSSTEVITHEEFTTGFVSSLF